MNLAEDEGTTSIRFTEIGAAFPEIRRPAASEVVTYSAVAGG